MPGKLSAYFNEIHDTSGEKFGQIITALASVFGAFTFGICINPTYTFVAGAYIPPMAYVLKKVTDQSIKLIVRKMGNNAKIGGFIEETLSAMKLIISFGREKERLDEYNKIAQETYK